MRRAVILAAGKGTRLRPITDDRSKAMVPVVGKPLIEWALITLVENGVDDVILVVGPDDLLVRNYFEQECSLPVRTRFVIQEERLGMAHALRLAAPLVDGPFLLSACDSFTSTGHVGDLLAAFADADAVLSLLDVDVDKVSKSAAVELDGPVVRRIVEKPKKGEAPSSTVSLPLYALPENLLDLLAAVEPSSRGEYELQDALQALIAGGSRVVGVKADKRFQVSSPEDLLDLSLNLLRAGEGTRRPVRTAPGTSIDEPVRIEDGVTIGRDCEIGPDVYLERGCSVGDRAVIRRAIVLRGARVEAGMTVVGQVVSG